MRTHEKINYVEFPAKDLKRTKSFFEVAFGWSFVDYGPDYTESSEIPWSAGSFAIRNFPVPHPAEYMIEDSFVHFG